MALVSVLALQVLALQVLVVVRQVLVLRLEHLLPLQSGWEQQMLRAWMVKPWLQALQAQLVGSAWLH
jgi:hypothetical protein